MKISVMKKIEAAYLDLDVAVRYEEEDMPNDAPLRYGGSWKAVIDLFNGTVENWPQGKTLSFDMKVCDQGVYVLLDEHRKEITRIEGYVPNKLLPGDYGDYLQLDIDEKGKIKNWLRYPTLEDFEVVS